MRPIPPDYIPPTNLVIRVDLDPQSVVEAAALPADSGARRALRYQATVSKVTFINRIPALRDRLAALARGPGIQR